MFSIKTDIGNLKPITALQYHNFLILYFCNVGTYIESIF